MPSTKTSENFQTDKSAFRNVKVLNLMSETFTNDF